MGADCTGDGAVLDGEDEDRIILSLKGLRNMGMTLRWQFKILPYSLTRLFSAYFTNGNYHLETKD